MPLLLILMLSSVLPGSISQPAKDWEGSPFLQDGETRYACAGDSVTFNWRLNPKGSLVNVEEMQFQHQNEADFLKFNFANPDSIAVIDFPENKPERVLIPTDPKYAGRIEMNKREMTINRLKVSDSGLYSMVVEGGDRTTGDKKTISSTITLVVADDIMTTDKELHVSESVDAFFNETTGRHHKVLECGRFTYNTTPPFDVAWKVPGMSQVRSTEYRVSDGRFRLVLPLRMRTGNYGCSVTKQNAARACAKALVHSEIRLDATETRFWLLGKDLTRALTMIKGNNALTAKGDSTNAAKVSSLRQELTALENTLAAKDAELSSKDAQLDNLIAKLNATDAQLATKDAQLATKDAQLATKDAQLATKVTHLDAQLGNKTAELAVNISDLRDSLDASAIDWCRSIQYKMDSNPARAVSNGKGGLCDSNLKGWYRFTLHGQSATIPTSCVQKFHCGTAGPLWLDLEGGSLPQPGEQKVVKDCASYTSCCQWSSSVTVRNCGAYFIYLLNGTPDGCNHAYCTQN